MYAGLPIGRICGRRGLAAEIAGRADLFSVLHAMLPYSQATRPCYVAGAHIHRNQVTTETGISAFVINILSLLYLMTPGTAQNRS
ncbi:MAG: hypothetical protein ACREQ1_09145, partial [Woeseiaceae bacterium]